MRLGPGTHGFEPMSRRFLFQEVKKKRIIRGLKASQVGWMGILKLGVIIGQIGWKTVH